METAVFKHRGGCGEVRLRIGELILARSRVFALVGVSVGERLEQGIFRDDLSFGVEDGHENISGHESLGKGHRLLKIGKSVTPRDAVLEQREAAVVGVTTDRKFRHGCRHGSYYRDDPEILECEIFGGGSGKTLDRLLPGTEFCPLAGAIRPFRRRDQERKLTAIPLPPIMAAYFPSHLSPGSAAALVLVYA